jgi:peptide/nickel transport system ATP-binding protein
MSASGPLLEVRRLGIRTPGSQIVEDIGFRLERGKVLGLIGESGAGKSSIGLAALGYGRGGCRIAAGEVLFDGEDLASATPLRVRALRGVRLTYVAQSAADAFNPSHRIGAQIVESALEHGTLSRAEATARAEALLEQLGIPQPREFAQRFPHQVSGGQLQRAMTAMALCARPDLIVFDEPTTALDVTTQLGVLATIKRAIRDSGAAALYITHDLAVVAQIADEIMVLRHGRTVEHGSTAQIIGAPREEYTRKLVGLRSGRRHRAAGPAPEPLLTIDGVTAAYRGGDVVLHDVSMSVEHGRTLAVVGESGSGKSTLARVITGLLPPSKGSIRLGSETLPPRLSGRTREQLRRVQLVYQMADVAMNPRQTVLDIVGRPLALYFGMGLEQRRARVTELLRQTGLEEHHVARYPAELSGGQKQRVCIARALAAEPDVVICDEITAALDPLMADTILNLLLDIQARTNLSYVFITHDIATVRVIADSVAVMHRGRVVRCGPRDDVLAPPFDDYTALLLSSVPEMRPGWLEEVLARRNSTSATAGKGSHSAPA